MQEVKLFRVIETSRVAPDPPVNAYSFVTTSQLPVKWKAWDLRYTHDYGEFF
jgi:hypothetical protein